tara:strand:- start:61623 stop:62561 length:939 start_codon:yes stop_codon:yes gene_type:complete
MRNGRLRDLNLNHLLTLDAVLRYRNLTRAAEQLDVTQGAISQSLARLRKFFNDELLVRVGNSMEPTALGSSLEDPVARVLMSIETDIVVRAGFDPSEARGKLSICMTDLGEFTFLSPLLERLAKEAPNMKVASRALPDSELARYMADGTIDLAFAGPIEEVADLKVQKIFEHELVAIVAETCPLPDVVSVEDYTSLPHLVLDSPYIKRVRIDQTLDKLGFKREIHLSTPNALIHPFLLEKNAKLIATLPRAFAERVAGVLPVRILKLGFEVPKLEVFQYWHPRFDRHEPSIWLRRQVVELSTQLANGSVSVW